MEKQKALIIVVALMLIPLVSAWDFDNVVKYSNDNKVVTITNAYGLGSDIAVIKLLTPMINYVNLGKDIRVMEFEVENYGNEYENAIKQMDIYDLRKGGEREDKDYHYEYYDEKKEEWKKLNSKNIPKGKIKIALVTDVYVSDYYDGIPTLFGIEVSEWAAWTSALNVGLISYYNFENETATSTNLIDVVRGKHNGTLTAGDNNAWIAGLIGEGFDFTGNDYFTINDNVDFDDINLTISIWAKPDSSADIWLLNKWAGVGDRLTIYLPSASDKWYGFIKSVNIGSDNIASIGNWNHIVLTYNGTKFAMYINGVIQTTIQPETGTFSNAANWYIGWENTEAEAKFEGIIDELGIWNRSLSVTEIENLYNAGAGISYVAAGDTFGVTTTLQSPVSDISFANATTVQFNATLTAIAGNISNATLYIWNSTGAVVNKTIKTGLTGTSNISSINVSVINTGVNTWNVFGCGINDTDYNCTFGTNRTFTVTPFNTGNITFAYNVSETSTHNFYINITNTIGIVGNSYLVYNGTSYLATKIQDGTTYSFSRDLTIPLGIAGFGYENRSFSFVINIDGCSNATLGTWEQTVNEIQLGICNSTLTKAYVNLTFKNEVDNTDGNASIDSSAWIYWAGDDGSINRTLSYTNSVENKSFAFCFSQPFETLYHSSTIQYSASGFPQRRTIFSTTLTNTTLNKILYLLPSTSGIYSIYQVQDAAGNSISGVSALAERQISGAWTTLETGTTDSAGTVTFWLNPDYDHRLTFTKSGYTSVQVTIRPSSSTYTVVMSSGGDAGGEYNSSVEGLRWNVGPRQTILIKNQNYNFWFNITSSINPLDSCKMELLDNMSNVISTTTGCTSTGGNLSVVFNVSTYPSIRGRYSVSIGGEWIVLDADSAWLLTITLDIPPRGTISAFFTHIRTIRQFGDEEGRVAFSRILLFFLILFMVLGFLCYTTGWDFATTGGALLLVVPIVLMASMGGFFEINYLPSLKTDMIPAEWIQKYSIALITCLIGLGYAFNKLADGRG